MPPRPICGSSPHNAPAATSRCTIVPRAAADGGQAGAGGGPKTRSRFMPATGRGQRAMRSRGLPAGRNPGFVTATRTRRCSGTRSRKALPPASTARDSPGVRRADPEVVSWIIRRPGPAAAETGTLTPPRATLWAQPARISQGLDPPKNRRIIDGSRSQQMRGLFAAPGALIPRPPPVISSRTSDTPP